ncbi:leukocyte surface antigen CD53 isoform X2 [Sciurus carolinensis]|uniref:leukocyte surface antigen CD53 isoform X2 n=1 Tax=Sciurus carolinensis TaxID=30640 RepID=UPI001FB48DA2|nr:leukocyte surface antigen CD53 isoform X2 [Sciurus carolinensis]
MCLSSWVPLSWWLPSWAAWALSKRISACLCRNILQEYRDLPECFYGGEGWIRNWVQCCKHVPALPQFFVLLLIILLAEVTLAILLFVYEQKLSKYVAEGLTESIHRYHSDNSTKMAWDFIQSYLHCCGVNSTNDWTHGIPESCPQDEHVKGCYVKAQQWFHSNFLYIGIITICVCVIQVLGMSFALTLNCQIDKTTQALGL